MLFPVSVSIDLVQVRAKTFLRKMETTFSIATISLSDSDKGQPALLGFSNWRNETATPWENQAKSL